MHLFNGLMGARGEQIRRMILLVKMLLIGFKLKNCGYFLRSKRSSIFFQCKRSDHSRALVLLHLSIFEPLMIILHKFLMSPLLIFYLFFFRVLLPILRGIHEPLIIRNGYFILTLVEVFFSAAGQRMDIRSYKFFVIGCLGTLRRQAQVGGGGPTLMRTRFAGHVETGNKLVEVYGPNLLLFLLRTSIHLIITYLMAKEISGNQDGTKIWQGYLAEILKILLIV